MKRIYLATSYTWKSWMIKIPVLGKLLHNIVMFTRYWRVTRTTAVLLRYGVNIFSPITHSHHIPKWLPDRLNTHSFWLELDFDWLSTCDEMWVFMQSGWAESYGVQEEIKYCQKMGIPIKFVNTEYQLRSDPQLLDTFD